MFDQAALVSEAKKHLYPNYAQPPIVLVRGSGCEVWDASGRRYLDFFAGIAVNSLGHAHPKLVRAIAQQASQLLHVSNYFYNEPNIRLAAKLCELSGMDRALFCNSGTEAVEAMLKMARRYQFQRGKVDRFRVISFHGSFHGRTMGSLAVTGQPKYRDGFGPLVGVSHVPFGDIDAVERAMGPDVAAVIAEPIQGEGGVVPTPPGFLAALRQLTIDHDALLILDEVQTGIGRTGSFLATQSEGVKPDAVAVAKGLGGGFPIGAVLCTEALTQALPPGSHGSTFAGNPLASMAALTVLETLQEDGLMGAVRERGEHLGKALKRLVAAHPSKLKDHRGVGLLQVVVLAPGVEVSPLLGKLREGGLLLTVAGGNALRFSPPLVVTVPQLDEGASILDRVLAAS